MLTLFHAPQSRSSRIVWLLEELGAEYELNYVDIPRMDGSGALDARNPHPDKKVPALLHGGDLVTESAAICLYLTDLYPDAGIGPTVGSAKRGSYLSWLAYYAGVVEPVVSIGFAGVEDNEFLRTAFRGSGEMHDRIIGVLRDHPYLLGDSFSAADVLLGSVGHWAREALPAGEPVDGYLAKLNSRPALIRAFEKDSPS